MRRATAARGEKVVRSRLSPMSRTCLQMSGSRKISEQSGAVAAAGERRLFGRRAVALGRQAEAGVEGGLAGLAMGQAIAVTVGASVPDPWRSDVSVAV